MSTIIETNNLTKRYGSTTVVDDLGLEIPTGAVYGFLGPNGSGKTTTMKMLLGIVRPSTGSITFHGRPVTPENIQDVRTHIGSLIEAPPGYGHLTGAENMRVAAKMLSIDDPQVTRAVDAVRLGRHMNKKVRDFSLGMKQRLGIAIALARQPELLILDEPTNGLDPSGIEEIRELLTSLASNGVTVLISSHLLEEIDKMATHLGILSGGRLIFQGTRSELFHASTPDLLISCSDPADAGALVPEAEITRDGIKLPGGPSGHTAGIVRMLVEHRHEVYQVRHGEQSLEDVFMSLTEGGQL